MAETPPIKTPGRLNKWPVYKCYKCGHDVQGALSPYGLLCTQCGGDHYERVHGSTGYEVGEADEEETELIFAKEEELLKEDSCMKYKSCAQCGCDIDKCVENKFLHVLEARPDHQGMVVPAYKGGATNFCSYACLVNFCVETKEKLLQ